MYRPSLFYTCIILIVTLFLNNVNGDDAPNNTLPEIASSYSTYLSYNDYLNGVTFAFKEYYQRDLNISRVETSQDTTIVDLVNKVYYQWNNSNPTTCYKYQNIPEYMTPSYIRYHQYEANYTFSGYTIIDRGINCSLYTKNIQTVIPGNTYISSVVFPTNISIDAVTYLNSSCQLILNDTATLAINATCNITQDNITTCSFFNTTDTVDCYFGLQLDLAAIYNFSTNGVDGYTTSNSTTDSISINFDINLYLDQYNALIRQMVNGTYSNQSMTAELDYVDWTPSTDMQPSLFTIPTNCLDATSPSQYNITTTKNITAPISTLDINNLLNNTFKVVLEEKIDSVTQSLEWHKDVSMESWEYDYSVGGDIIKVYNNANQSQSFAFNAFTLVCQPNQASPDYQSDARRNIVYQILALRSVTGWTYETRTVRRLVDTDTYIATFVNGTTTYTVRLYIFAPGWQFPGRAGVTNSTIIPLAIESNTTIGTTTYSDSWDLYFYSPESFPDAYSTSDKIGCFPSAPSVYSSTVLISVQDYGTTFQFDEYSIANKSYASIGKFGASPTDRSVIDYDSQTYSVVSASNCTKYTVDSTIISSTNIGPSTAYLARANGMGATQYLGLNNVRGVNAMTWQAKAVSVPIGNSSLVQTSTFTYYWTKDAVTGQNIPVRVTVSGIEYNTSDVTNVRNFSISVDWILFNLAQPSPSKFQVPDTCVANTTLPPAFSNNLLPSKRYVVPTVNATATLPPISSSFTMILNVAISNSSNPTTPATYTVRWTYDTVHLSEGVEILNQNGTTGDKYLFCYTKTMGGSGTYSKNGMTQVYTVNPQFYNILRNLGDSSLSATFYQPQMQSQYKLQSYVGYNGVYAENWVWTNTNQSNANQTSFYWYPSDWSISSSNGTIRVPIAIINTDTSGSDSNFTTTETWDILSYQPGVASFDTFGGDVVCKPATYEKFTDNYIAVGTLVVIVIICSTVAVVLALLGFKYLKKRGYLSYLDPKQSHIRLDDRNPTNPNQIHNDDQHLMREEEL